MSPPKNVFLAAQDGRECRAGAGAVCIHVLCAVVTDRDLSECGLQQVALELIVRCSRSED